VLYFETINTKYPNIKKILEIAKKIFFGLGPLLIMPSWATIIIIIMEWPKELCNYSKARKTLEELIHQLQQPDDRVHSILKEAVASLDETYSQQSWNFVIAELAAKARDDSENVENARKARTQAMAFI